MIIFSRSLVRRVNMAIAIRLQPAHVLECRFLRAALPLDIRSRLCGLYERDGAPNLNPQVEA